MKPEVPFVDAMFNKFTFWDFSLSFLWAFKYHRRRIAWPVGRDRIEFLEVNQLTSSSHNFNSIGKNEKRLVLYNSLKSTTKYCRINFHQLRPRAHQVNKWIAISWLLGTMDNLQQICNQRSSFVLQSSFIGVEVNSKHTDSINTLWTTSLVIRWRKLVTSTRVCFTHKIRFINNKVYTALDVDIRSFPWQPTRWSSNKLYATWWSFVNNGIE